MTTLEDLSRAIRGEAGLEEAEDVLALVLLRDPSSLQAEGLALLERFAARARIDPALPGPALEAAVQAYLDAHPLSAAVLGSLRTVAEGLLAKKGPRSADVDAALSLLGAEASRVPLSARPKPAGSVPAGPLARFTLDPKPNKKPNRK